MTKVGRDLLLVDISLSTDQVEDSAISSLYRTLSVWMQFSDVGDSDFNAFQFLFKLPPILGEPITTLIFYFKRCEVRLQALKKFDCFDVHIGTSELGFYKIAYPKAVPVNQIERL